MATVKTFRVDGSLSYDEIDDNFDNLNEDKIERIVSVNDASVGLSVTQTGDGQALNVNSGKLVVDSSKVSIGDKLSIQDELELGSSVGTLGQVLVSSGVGAVPVWNTLSNVELIQTKAVTSGSNTTTFTGLDFTKYQSVYIVFYAIQHSSTSASLRLGGSEPLSAAYNGTTALAVGKYQFDFFRTLDSIERGVFTGMLFVSSSAGSGAATHIYAGDAAGYVRRTTTTFNIQTSAGTFTSGTFILYGIKQ